MFEFAAILVHHSHQGWFWMSCDVDSGTRDFRLHSYRLFYLCQWSIQNCHSVKNKRDESSLKIYVTTLLMSILWSVDRPQENRICRFLKIQTILKHFFAELNCVKYMIRWENENFDVVAILTVKKIYFLLTFFSCSILHNLDLSRVMVPWW